MSYETEVSADDQRSFVLFRKAVHALHGCGLLEKARTLKLDPFSTGEPTHLDTITSDEFKSFLTSFRHFTLSDDKAQFGYIHGLFRKNCEHENLKKWADYANRLWNSTMRSRPFIFEGQTEQIDVQRSLNLYFYSGVAHFRDEQTKTMDELPSIGKDTMTNGMFHALESLIHSLNMLDALVHHLQNGTEDSVPESKAESA